MGKYNLNNRSGGASALELLSIAFIVLKLTGEISWSWWWVVAPIWGIMVVIVMTGAITFIIQVISHRVSDK